MFRQVVISSTRSKLAASYGSIGSARNESRHDPEVTSSDQYRSQSASASEVKRSKQCRKRPWTTIGHSGRHDSGKENHFAADTMTGDLETSDHLGKINEQPNEDQVAIGRLQKINVHQRLRNLRSAFAERAERAQTDFTARLTAPPPDSDDEEDDLLRPPKQLPVDPERLQQLLDGQIPFEQLLDDWAEEDFLNQVDPCPAEPIVTVETKIDLRTSKSLSKDAEDDEFEEDDENASSDALDLDDQIWSKKSVTRPTLWSSCAASVAQSIQDKQMPTVNPRGAMYVFWLFILAFAFVYNALFVPYRAVFHSFATSTSGQQVSIASHSGHFDFFRLDLVSDLLYTLHLFLWQPHLRFVQNGLWVPDAVATRNRYFASKQFWIDTISWAPIDWLVLACQQAEWAMRDQHSASAYTTAPSIQLEPLFRLNRLLQAQSFWRLFDRLDSRARWPHLVRICRTLFHMAYLVHVNACAYYALSAYLGIGSDRWVYNGQGRAYLRCFYFALRTATSISGKMPRPERDSQRLYMAAAWLLGVFVFAFLIGQIRDIVGQAQRQHAMYRAMADRIALMLRDLRVPETLRLRASAWLAFTWKEQHTIDEQQIVNLLPSKCRLDIALAEHLPVLRKVNLFRGCDRSAMRELLLRLRPRQYLPGDYVFKFGEPASHMYIVGSGQLLVCAESGHVLATLGAGTVFGELAVLQLPSGCNRRTASVKAVGFCTLFVLSKLDLWDTLGNYPDTERLLRQRARCMFKKRKAASQIQLANVRKHIDQISDVIRAESVISAAPSDRRRLTDTVENVLKVIRGQRKRNQVESNPN
jgi:CRP-like cAMP-binding protein